MQLINATHTLLPYITLALAFLPFPNIALKTWFQNIVCLFAGTGSTKTLPVTIRTRETHLSSFLQHRAAL